MDDASRVAFHVRVLVDDETIVVHACEEGTTGHQESDFKAQLVTLLATGGIPYSKKELKLAIAQGTVDLPQSIIEKFQANIDIMGGLKNLEDACSASLISIPQTLPTNRIKHMVVMGHNMDRRLTAIKVGYVVWLAWEAAQRDDEVD